MKAVVDPFDQTAMCGSCRTVYGLIVWAEDCCEPEPDQERWRPAVAFVAVALGVLFTILLGTC